MGESILGITNPEVGPGASPLAISTQQPDTQRPSQHQDAQRGNCAQSHSGQRYDFEPRGGSHLTGFGNLLEILAGRPVELDLERLYSIPHSAVRFSSIGPAAREAALRSD